MTESTLTLTLNRPPRRRITTLGYGSRVAVWLQGCDLACPGCMSRDTWDRAAGLVVTPEELAAAILEAGAHDGLTVSGGEPFAQAEGLAALLELVRSDTPSDFDILCYSGHRYERLAKRHRATLAHLDVLIDGPFRQRQPTLLPWRGSANQRLIAFTDLGRARYAGADIPQPRPPLQLIHTDPDDPIEYAGIPSPGDLERLEGAAEAVGVRLEGASWHP